MNLYITYKWVRWSKELRNITFAQSGDLSFGNIENNQSVLMQLSRAWVPWLVPSYKKTRLFDESREFGDPTKNNFIVPTPHTSMADADEGFIVHNNQEFVD